MKRDHTCTMCTCRLSLPEMWHGLRGAELDAVAGIPDCVFVHSSGFIGGHQTLDGVLKMARHCLTTTDNTIINCSFAQISRSHYKNRSRNYSFVKNMPHCSYYGNSLSSWCLWLLWWVDIVFSMSTATGPRALLTQRLRSLPTTRQKERGRGRG